MIEFIIFWVVCSVISYGASFAYFQRGFAIIAEQSYRQDLIVCLVMSILGGPCWLLSCFLFGEQFKRGFKFK